MLVLLVSVPDMPPILIQTYFSYFPEPMTCTLSKQTLLGRLIRVKRSGGSSAVYD